MQSQQKKCKYFSEMILQNSCTDCTASVFILRNCSRSFISICWSFYRYSPQGWVCVCLCTRVPVCIHVRQVLCPNLAHTEEFRSGFGKGIKSNVHWTLAVSECAHIWPPTVIGKQTALTSASFRLQTCSLLDLLTQLEACPSQQVRILKLQAQFPSATVFISHIFAFALPYCWSDGGSDENILWCSSGAWDFFFLFPDFPGFRNGWLRKREDMLEDRCVGRQVSYQRQSELLGDKPCPTLHQAGAAPSLNMQKSPCFPLTFVNDLLILQVSRVPSLSLQKALLNSFQYYIVPLARVRSVRGHWRLLSFPVISFFSVSGFTVIFCFMATF